MTSNCHSDIASGDRPEPHYRIQLLTPNHQIISTVVFKARDDVSALEIAEGMVDGHAVELWDDLRFIERFEPHSG